MEGCSKYCTFCVVPYTRGEEVSRPLEQVLDEVARLAAQGVREVTLLGQNVNAYRGHDRRRRPRRPRRRSSTSSPRCPASSASASRLRTRVEFRDSLIEAYRDVPKLANHLHLPVQSGSDRVLALMKRGHTVLEYKQKIRRLREVRPGISCRRISSSAFRARPSATSRRR